MRLRELIPDGTVKEFALEIGMDLPQLMRYRSGETVNPTLATIERFARALEVSPSFLLTGEETPVSRVSESSAVYGVDAVPLPVLAQEIAAGPVRELDERETGAPYYFRPEFIRRAGGVRNLRLLHISRHPAYGSSMLPTIRPGSLVLVDRREVTKDTFRQGAIYIVRSETDEGVTVKRAWYADGILVAWGDNPDAPRFAIPVKGTRLADHLRGRVVWWSTEDL